MTFFATRTSRYQDRPANDDDRPDAGKMERAMVCFGKAAKPIEENVRTGGFLFFLRMASYLRCFCFFSVSRRSLFSLGLTWRWFSTSSIESLSAT